MANEGIQLKIHKFDNIMGPPDAVIEGRRNPKMLDELGGYGGGSFLVSRDDPKIVADPALLNSRNVCKVFVEGVAQGAFILNDRLSTIVSPSENAERAYEVSGPGLKAWFDDATVYPYGGLKATSRAERNFNFSSEISTWYDSSQWVNVFDIGKIDATAHYGNKVPENWPPDAKAARWVWASAYAPSMPFGWSYFRYTITIAEEGSYAIYTAVDDTYVLYVDGEQRADYGNDDTKAGWREASKIELQLSVGTHVIAYAARNMNTPATQGPAALAMAITKVQDNGDEKTVGYSQVSGWKVMPYPAQPPGWTAGNILLNLLNEAKARGVWFPNHLTPTFTATTDSYGQPWAKEVNWSFSVGESLSSVLAKLEEASVDVWINPDTLQLNMAPTRGVDRSVFKYDVDGISVTAAPINFILGKHLTQAKTQSQGKIKNNLTLKTKEGWATANKSTSVDKYGRLESTLDVDSSVAAASNLASVLFRHRAEEEEGATYELELQGQKGTAIRPFVNFDVGDWVLAPNERGLQVKRRAMSISVEEKDNGYPSYHIEFDTIFQDREQKLASIVNKLSGGGAGAGMAGTGSSNYGDPTIIIPPPTPPKKKLKSPTGLAVSSVGNWSADGITPQSEATVTWNPVTQYTDNTAAVTYLYDVQTRLNGSGDGWVSQGTTSATTLILRSYKAGDKWDFRVLAVTEELIASSPSSTVTHTMVGPTAAMAKPTTPILSTDKGILFVKSDGNLATSPVAPPPPQFRYFFAEIKAATTGYDPQVWTQTGPLIGRGGGTIPIGELQVGKSYQVRLTAVDGIGIKSPVSSIATITVKGVDLGNLDQSVTDAIDAAEEAAKQARNQANMLADPSFELNTNEHWTYGPNTTNLATAGVARTNTRFLQIKAGTVITTALTSTQVFNCDEGDNFFLRAYMRAANASVTEDGLVITVTYGATETTMTNVASVAPSGVLVNGQPWKAVSGTWTVPAGAKYFKVGLTTYDVNNVSLYRVDDFRLLRMTGITDLVVGSVTGDVIAGDTITAFNLAADSVATRNLQADSVATRNLQADSVDTRALKSSSVTSDIVDAGAIKTSHISSEVGRELNIENNTSINLVVGQITGVSNDLSNTNANIEVMQTYYRFGPDGAIISSPGSIFATAVRNDRIEMLENGNVVSYWNSGVMYVNQFVGEVVTVGNHQIAKYLTGTVVRAL